jgi:hypothetical protein
MSASYSCRFAPEESGLHYGDTFQVVCEGLYPAGNQIPAVQSVASLYNATAIYISINNNNNNINNNNNNTMSNNT